MTAQVLRIPSNSVDAEQSILGGLLLDNGAWERLDGRVAADDFYRHDHRLIFGSVASLLDRGMPADVLTVYDALQAEGNSEAVGGLQYLNAIAQNVPSSANIRRYAEIVRDHRIRRDLAAVGQQIAELANEPGESSGLVERATGLTMALADTREAGQDPKSIGELLPGVLDALEARMEHGGAVSGLSTGFEDLDRQTCGLQPGDLVIVAGRPSMGKTTLAVNVAENVAVDEKVAFVVSLEMSAAQLAERSVARFGEIDTQKLRAGRLSPEDFNRLSAALGRLENQRLVISDDPRLANASRIRLAARKVRQRQGRLDLIVIDYLQLMQGEGGNRNEELGGITRSLKLLAKEMGCPIILLSQLSREVEKRTDKRPLMSDLRESGAIEQDADVILMAYRDDYYMPDSPFKGMAEILIRKQRMGPLGDVFLVFKGQYSCFCDADPHAVTQAKNSAPSKPKYRALRD